MYRITRQRSAWRFAQGNVGKAKQIATAEDFADMMDAALKILKKGDGMEVYEMVDAIKTSQRRSTRCMSIWTCF